MIQSLTVSAPAPAPASFTVREACAALGVSESGFYAHRRKEQRPRRQQDKVIGGAMKEVFEQNYGCYGSPRLVRALRQRGVRCGSGACAAVKLAFAA